MDPVVAGLIGAGLSTVTNFLVGWAKSREDGKRQGRSDALAEWAKIHEQDERDKSAMQARIDRIEGEMRAMAEREQRCERRFDRLAAYTQSLQGSLAAAGVPVPRFDPNGTDVFRALPPEAGQ